MIAAVIGKTFLKAFNEKYGQNLNAKSFFEEHYFKTFFDHPKYMQWITNSPFVQMKAGQKPHLLTADERTEKLMDLHSKVAEGVPDASFAIGFSASEVKEFATTSGLVTDLILPSDEDEVYFSWIGGGLGIGVAGGYSIFFDQPDILLKTFEGWSVYRKYLNNPSLEKLRGNQINTWNGQWLTFAFGEDYRETFDFAFLEQFGVFKSDSEKIEVNTINWSRLFFSISQQFPDESFTGYVFSLGQTNKTVGFIPFHFKSGSELKRVYRKLFDHELQKVDTKTFETLFGIHIKRACELGAIGLQALRPDGLKKYFSDPANLKLTLPDVKSKAGEDEEEYRERKEKLLEKDRENVIQYQVYKTWLVAMLTKNKEEITDYTQSIAEALHRYRKGATKLDRKTLIEKELFPAKTKKSFLDALTQIIKDVEEPDLVAFKTVRDEIHLMTNEEYGYFVTLLKFDYAYQERTFNINN